MIFLPTDPTVRRFYSVTVSTRATSRRGTCWVWSPPYLSAREAEQAGKEAVDSGDATTAYVVMARGQEREILISRTYPRQYVRVLQHYEDLWDKLDPPPEEKQT